MYKFLLLLSSVILLGTAPIGKPGSTPQSPAPAATQAPATTPTPSSSVKNPVKPTVESQSKAKKTYGFDCALCHGANGDGKTDLAKDMSLTLADLSDPKSLAGMSDGDIFDLIRKGKDKMPPEDVGRAKDDDVWNLVIYVRSLSKGGATSGAQ